MIGSTPNRTSVATLIFAFAALTGIPSASAQQSDRRLENALAAPGGEKDAREMVEVVMMVRLSRELDLSEEETVLLVRRMGDFREELRGLHRQRRRLMGELRSVAQTDRNDEEILATLEALIEVDRRLNNIKLDLHERLSEGLDARQQARLYVFLQEFEENMRRMIQRVRERSRALEGGRMGRGNPPPQRMMRDRLPHDAPRREGRTPSDRRPSRDSSVGNSDVNSDSVRESASDPN